MSFYLYLNEHAYADTWVLGGKIPIKPASSYKSIERGGIYTPDECVIHKSTADLCSFSPYVEFENVHNLNIIGAVFDGKKIPDILNASLYEEDGIILSFSTRLSKSVATKLGKKACIKINEMQKLKLIIDEQLGIASRAGFCEYTSSHERNHFLKSDLDSWQAEYRLFWPTTNEAQVCLPAGLAEHLMKW